MEGKNGLLVRVKAERFGWGKFEWEVFVGMFG